MALLSWTGANLWTAALAIAIWGIFSWSIQAPQQSRLVALAPTAAPVVLGLNNTGTYLGVTAAGVIGATGIQSVGPHNLGIVGTVLVILALVVCELATWRIGAASRSETALATA
jgi:predicted MFS family arabinose efflux permease